MKKNYFLTHEIKYWKCKCGAFFSDWDATDDNKKIAQCPECHVLLEGKPEYNEKGEKAFNSMYDDLVNYNKFNNFTNSMLTELSNNLYKGSIYEFTNFEKIITEIEYHKAKMFLAIRLKNKQAIKEYIADTANFLLALGNSFGLYDNEFIDKSKGDSFEINKEINILIKTSTPSKNQSLI